LSSAADGYATLAVDHGHLGGLAPWAAWYETNVFVVFLATVLYSLLLFPSGRLLTPRWRIVFWGGSAGVLLVTVSALLGGGDLTDYPKLQSPVGIDSPVVSWLFAPGFVAFSASLVAAAVSVVLRFRRARGIERQQLTLLMAAGAFAATTFVVSGFVG